MSYNVLTIPPFDRQLKRLAKKYPSLKTEYAKLIENLEAETFKGVALTNALLFDLMPSSQHHIIRQDLCQS